jgi:membrane protein YqaA with SNARE-associated domain
LFVASMSETIIVPIPFEAILVPMMLANRGRLWWLATISLLGCIAGSIIGYAIGYFAFEAAGRPLLAALHFTDAFQLFQKEFQERGFWLIVAVGITPVPFQVATIGSGVVSFSPWLFLLGVGISRSIRYYGLALLTRAFGPRIETLLRRYRKPASIGFWLLLAGVIVYTALSSNLLR